MNNSKNLLTRPLRQIPSSLSVFLLIIALLGFADATYLTIEHYLGVIPPCSIVSGCETVLSSPYATVLGVPVSLAGSIYYLLILIGLYIYIDIKKTKYLKGALFLSALGFLMSLGLISIMAFVLHAFCLYCLGSALTSTILFISACVIFKKYSDIYVSDLSSQPSAE